MSSLKNFRNNESEEDSLKDNEIAIVADGIHVLVQEAYGDEEIILEKQFGEMEIVTFERHGPVDIFFTDGSRIRVVIGDLEPLQPNTDKEGRIRIDAYESYKKLEEDPTNKPLTKESFGDIILHLMKMKTGIYIILMPHIYISYQFEDLITFENSKILPWGLGE